MLEAQREDEREEEPDTGDEAVEESTPDMTSSESSSLKAGSSEKDGIADIFPAWLALVLLGTGAGVLLVAVGALQSVIITQ